MCGLNNSALDKTVLDDVLLYKNNTSQGTLAIFCFLHFIKFFHTWTFCPTRKTRDKALKMAGKHTRTL